MKLPPRRRHTLGVRESSMPSRNDTLIVIH